jgi:hypothetical protein
MSYCHYSFLLHGSDIKKLMKEHLILSAKVETTVFKIGITEIIHGENMKCR